MGEQELHTAYGGQPEYSANKGRVCGK